MRRLLAFIFALALLLIPATAFADGIIIDPPCLPEQPCPPPPPCDVWPCPRPLFPLAIQYHRVTVTLENQVATTRVDQLFRNDNNFTVEGTYIFPLPTDAAVSEFAMWVDGQKVEGKVLSAEEARRIYDDIVRQSRDPALLEYIGRGAVQASIFPIPPGETRRIELEYAQVLAADNGLIHYRYPLNTEKFSAQPLEQVSISVKVTSPDPVRAVYSPTHNIAVEREGDYRFSAGYEANNLTPDTDFDLYYSVSADHIGLNLLTYRDPDSGEGFFLLLAAPSLNVDAAQVVAKDVIVVLDQSGSMDGEKFQQAQAALKYVLNHLNPEDRFNVIAFSTGTEQYARGLRPASDAPEAARWVDSLAAAGGTNINLALLEALDSADAARPTILIFLTDGLATEGVTDTDRILANVQQAAPENVRLFAFGVGNDVDTILLDTLVEQNHGASSYVRPGERIDEAVSGFYAKVSTPVLSNIALDFGSVIASDMYPNPLPDLFAGGQLVIAGRYRDPGPATITLKGTVNGQPQSFTYDDQFFRESGGSEFVPRLWATRKIGYLLNQIRLHGENKELIDSIVKLSVRYGIVTPYTSYLVTEGERALSDEGRNRIAEEQYAESATATAAPSGADAVDRSVAQSGIAAAEAPAAPEGDAANVVKIVGSRTFLFSNGVWIDTAFDPTAMTATKVEFASDDYFTLLAARPELSAPFALGSRVIAFADDGSAYEVTDASAPPLVVPPTYTPEPNATEIANVNATPPAGATRAPENPAPAGRSPSGSLCFGIIFLPMLVAIPFLLHRKKVSR
jgi:Ca-activated chloride channel family protein